MRYLIVVLGVLALLATACGDVADRLGGETGEGAASVEVGGDEGSAPVPAGGADEPTEPAESGDSSEGVETVTAGDAGEVDVRVHDGNRLELVEVREAPGWSHNVDDLERDEIEIDFRHEDGRELELEIELEDGRLDVEVD